MLLGANALEHPIDLEILGRYTGQTVVRTISEARRQLDSSTADLRSAKRARPSRIWLVYLWLRWYSVHRGLARWALGLIAGSAAALVLAGVVALCGAGLPTVLLVLAASYIVVGGGVLLLLRDAAGEDEANRLQVRTDALTRANSVARYARQRFIAAMQSRHDARQLFDGVRAAQNSALNRLLNVNCNLMSGEQFEHYLAVIFRSLGYKTEHTGRTGDQGVDLIIERNCKVAVQAKCYSGNVGNDAVQQAFSGMAFYGCKACAVVTNSTFTNAARELAQRTGCRLIEGNQLPSLIRGQVNL